MDQDAYFGSENAQKICTDAAPIPLPVKYQNPANSLVSGAVFGYLVNHHGRNKPNTYGSFPAVTVRALVIGSIPASVTVHLEQTVTNGYLDPIKALYSKILGITNAGGLVYPGFPAAPTIPDGVPTDRILVFKNQFDATLRLRLSDVTLDGRPVEVGARCSPVSPVRLTVREPLGLYGNLDPRTTVRGQPGHFQPVAGTEGRPPGWFDGNVNIPAFAHCGSATENLDPLLTARISSPSNPVKGFLPTSALLDFSCSSAVADSTCPPAATAGQRRMRALATGIAAHKSPATIRALQARLTPSDYVVPKLKPDGDS